MSSRAARKLLKLREQEIQKAAAVQKDDDDAESDDEEEVPAAPSNKQNLFALLNGSVDEDVDDDNDGEEEAPRVIADLKIEDEEEEEEDAAASPVQTKSTNKKKKKKKGKSKANDTTESVSKKTIDMKSDIVDRDLDEVEAALREINEKFGKSEPADRTLSAAVKSQQPRKSQKPLLGVESKFLDADAELRRMFGSKIVADDIKAKRYVRGGGAATSVGRTNLATPRDTWPRYDGRLGIQMQMVSAPSRAGDSDPQPGVFQFVYSQSYLEVQQIFQICVDSHDPQTLTNLLRSNPYHIDALLQLSEVARHNTNMSVAAEYIERSLYAFERSFHTMFNPATAFCRLSYLHRENRAFFLALSRQIGFVAKKGCWRTALELTKYLLALDPEDDPLGAILLLDIFAIKANELAWFKRLWKEWAGEDDSAVVGLPNLEFGIALAERELELAKKSEHTRSTQLLRRALLSYPQALPLILERAAVTDTKLTSSAFFSPITDENASENALSVLTKLFVERSHPLWKEPEVLQWLRSTASSIASLPSDHPDVVEADNTRKTAYPDGLPLNVSRHIFVSEFTSMIPLLPKSATARGMNVFDPMPPDTRMEDPNLDPGAARTAQGGGVLGWVMQNMAALLRGNGPEADEDDDEDEDEDDGDAFETDDEV